MLQHYVFLKYRDGTSRSHVQAFCEVLEYAAGLPPAGVTDLAARTRA